jgi:predicted RNA-binding protein YlqC (UPF0109 family)
MTELVSYVVGSLVEYPDDMTIEVIEGDASVLIELQVHDDDRQRLTANDGALIASIQQVLAIAGGDRKPVLDLVNRDGEAAEA